MSTRQRKGSAASRWHHPRVRHRRDGWVWNCRCGAFGHGGDSTSAWRLVCIAALSHADQATR